MVTPPHEMHQSGSQSVQSHGAGCSTEGHKLEFTVVFCGFGAEGPQQGQPLRLAVQEFHGKSE